MRASASLWICVVNVYVWVLLLPLWPPVVVPHSTEVGRPQSSRWACPPCSPGLPLCWRHPHASPWPLSGTHKLSGRLQDPDDGTLIWGWHRERVKIVNTNKQLFEDHMLFCEHWHLMYWMYLDFHHWHFNGLGIGTTALEYSRFSNATIGLWLSLERLLN